MAIVRHKLERNCEGIGPCYMTTIDSCVCNDFDYLVHHPCRSCQHTFLSISTALECGGISFRRLALSSNFEHRCFLCLIRACEELWTLMSNENLV